MVEVEVIRPLESPNSFCGWEKESYVDGGVSFMSERCLGIEVNRGSLKEMHSGERVHSPAQNSVLFTNDGQPASPDVTFGASELPQPPEVSERPKLKLLPRTKPLEVQEPPVVVHSQGSQQQIDTIHSEAATVLENPRHAIARPSSSEASHRKPGVSGSEAEQRAVERPKLNLKPRSQPVNLSDGSTEIERKALFGGARPREMVLKERGVDDVVTSYDEAQAPSREVIPAHPNTSRQSERVNNLSIDQRIGRGHEKRDQRGNIHRFDLQRKNWHNDNQRGGRDSEKHRQERLPSPETWRKPVEPPNSNNSGLRFGKAVSAVDLVQAFSRSVSSPKPLDQLSSQKGLSGQKGLPARSLVPFSRLTGPTSTAQINGY